MCDVVGGCVPKSFEYEEMLVCLKDHPKIFKFATVLDTFTHHYSGDIMYRVRVEYFGYGSKIPMVEYETWDAAQMAMMLARHKEEN